VPGEQGAQVAKPGCAAVPAAQSVQTGGAPESQDQELSTELRANVPGTPAEPDVQEKRYVMAPSVGAAGVTTALAIEASGGCAIESTSEAERAR